VPSKVRIKQFINIVRFASKSAHQRILVQKIFTKVKNSCGSEADYAEKWAKANMIDLENWLETLDSDLWRSSVTESEKIRNNSLPTISKLESQGIDLGGGGSLELIYFWTRRIKPDFVLETGVAAGWSSYAFLNALKANGIGKLLSSDFPYFRIKDPEKYIGILVPDELRNCDWQVEINGDDLNLPKLLNSETKLQLIHYDSDKRKSGRVRFLSKIELYLDEDYVLIMDDIQNDLAFKEYVEKMNCTFRVISCEGKYVGVALFGKYQ
jgi:predicted O-methyltransferase YrrM